MPTRSPEDSHELPKSRYPGPSNHGWKNQNGWNGKQNVNTHLSGTYDQFDPGVCCTFVNKSLVF